MIKIGSIELTSKIGLSPMAGISDSPYRRICRRMGAPFSYTEFVSADEISHKSKRVIHHFKFSREEKPIWFQIFGNTKERLVEATKIVSELEPDVIDLNMGCSTQKVSGRGSGAGLLKNPSYAGEIIEAMTKATNVPITAKIRLGWDNQTRNYLEVVHILEESGAKMISVHGRTKEMGYSGIADWDAIAEIKSIAKVPIFGNGDITSPSEARFRLESSRVDGVLVGRAGIGNPWIFSGKNKQDCTSIEIKEMIRIHFLSMLEFYGEEHGVILFRKHLTKYLNLYESELKNKLVQETDPEKFLLELDSFPDEKLRLTSNLEDKNLTCETYI
ncbi:MAG: tRNA dihydrouridine synthase DusB [Leptospiraceae bacterium]|nr:tRNA dihydrouridine synthase DusB [Leptospiraceae bacterium]